MLDVPFLLGAIGAHALTGPSLIALLNGLGRQEAAARNLLTRMRDQGALEAEQRGRINLYRLASSSHARYEEVEGVRPEPVWDGTFDAILYHVPESARTLRDRVVHRARSSGYGLLRPGVLIAADERWSWLRLDDDEFVDPAWLQHASITPDSIADAQLMARRAWDLDDLATAYVRGLRRRVDATRQIEPGWPALRLWREVYATCFEAQLADPNLPAVLLPERWPKAAFSQAQEAMNREVFVVLQPFLREHADRSDGTGLNEYYQPHWAKRPACDAGPDESSQ